MMAGLGATIMQGMAFGTGSAIAHRAVGAAAGAMSGGSESSQPEAQQQQRAPVPAPSATPSACQHDMTAFNQCMSDNNNNVSSCDFFFKSLQQCQSSSNY